MSDKDLETFQLSGILYKGHYMFDFLYSNGLQSNSGCEGPMTEHLIKPDQIRMIYMHHFDGKYNNCLAGLLLLDKDSNILAHCGEWGSHYKNHTMLINEDERLVGVRSKTLKDGSDLGTHHDIEFLVCKYK